MAAAAIPGDHLHTPEELLLVQKLKDAFRDEFTRRAATATDHACLFGDIALLRVLRGNGNKLPQAIAWFARCLQKVAECDLDSMVVGMARKLDEAGTLTPLDDMLPFHDDIKEYVRAVFSAPQTTPCGDLVNYISFARFDMWAMMSRMKWSHWVHYMHGATIMRMIECDRQSRKQGRLVRVTTIIDVADCSFGMFNCPSWHVAHSRDLGSFQESVAAEIFGPVVVLNAPWLVQKVFAGALRFAPERFRHKIRIVDGDGTDDAAFVELAGGRAQLRQLLAVRESIFAEGAQADAAAPSGLTYRLRRREVIEQTLDISPGQVVAWEFEVRRGPGDGLFGDSDVAFSVDALWTAPGAEAPSAEDIFHCLTRQAWEPLLVQEQYSAARGCVKGSWRAARPGVLRLVWANRHSALRSKVVRSRVSVTSVPQAQEPHKCKGRPPSEKPAWNCCSGRYR